MKKKLLTSLMCLALLVGGSSALASCEKSATFYTISELLDYDRTEGQFSLSGEKVRLEDVTCIGTHGRTITVEESGSTTCIEVVLSDDSPDVTMTTLVNVEGTLTTTNGRAQIVNAVAETVDSSSQNFTYTTYLASSSGFDRLGRTDSGTIGGGIQANGLTPAKFKLISYNGSKEYVPGEDLILTVAYLGTDYTDSYNWLTLVLFGDSDESFIDYFNAFFFGTDTTVTWTGPFGSRSNRSVINAGWEGLEEGEDYFSCDLIHFFYDEVYNPSFGSMFFIDDVCLAYAEKLDLYNEQSDLGDAFTALNSAFNEGNETTAHYSNSIEFSYIQGDEITLNEYYAMTSSQQREYMNNAYRDTEYFTIDATPTRLVFTDTYYYDDEAEFSADVFYNFLDNGTPCVADLVFETKEALDTFLANPSKDNFNADGTDTYLYGVDVGYSWTDEFYSLYDMYIYSMNFHQEGTNHDVNDPTVSNALFDCLVANIIGSHAAWEEQTGFDFTIDTLSYNAASGAIICNYSDGAWYYGDSSYSTVLYIGYEVDNSIQLYLNNAQ